LVSIGLDKCFSFDDSAELESCFMEARKRHMNRADGKPVQTEVQKSFAELTAAFKESMKAFEHNLTADHITPHDDTKIIQFPQRFVFPGSA
jgi:hypothetical protein